MATGGVTWVRYALHWAMNIAGAVLGFWLARAWERRCR
jgi:hypothetical protein